MPNRIKSLESSINIIEAIGFSDSPPGISELARQTGLAKSAVFKHLNTLARRGYVMLDRTDGGYRIGPRFALMARFASPQGDLPAMAEPLMAEIRDAVDLPVVLSLPDRKGARVCCTVRNHALVEIGVRDGSLLPLHTSAQGKVVAAWFLPELAADTPIGIELATIRAQGFATAPDQVLVGINTIAVPVFDESARLVAALGVVGPTTLLSGETAERICAILIERAERLSHLIHTQGEDS